LGPLPTPPLTRAGTTRPSTRSRWWSPACTCRSSPRPAATGRSRCSRCHRATSAGGSSASSERRAGSVDRLAVLRRGGHLARGDVVRVQEGDPLLLGRLARQAVALLQDDAERRAVALDAVQVVLVHPPPVLAQQLAQVGPRARGVGVHGGSSFR